MRGKFVVPLDFLIELLFDPKLVKIDRFNDSGELFHQLFCPHIAAFAVAVPCPRAAVVDVPVHRAVQELLEFLVSGNAGSAEAALTEPRTFTSRL